MSFQKCYLQLKLNQYCYLKSYSNTTCCIVYPREYIPEYTTISCSFSITKSILIRLQNIKYRGFIRDMELYDLDPPINWNKFFLEYELIKKESITRLGYTETENIDIF